MPFPVLGAIAGAAGSWLLRSALFRGTTRGFLSSPFARGGGWILENAWKIDALEALVAKHSPTAKNSVTVRIIGQPQAVLNDLYQLAVATAVGIIFNGQYQLSSISAQGIQSRIDHMNKIVEVTLSRMANGAISSLTQSSEMKNMIRRPIPTSITAGKTWPTFLFGTALESKMPALNPLTDVQRVVSTDVPSNNPTLQFSNATRGFGNTEAQAAPLKTSVCDPVLPPINWLAYTGQPTTFTSQLSGVGQNLRGVGILQGGGGGAPLNQGQIAKLKNLFGM